MRNMRACPYPVTYAPSLTLFAQTRQAKPTFTVGHAPTAVVVGDPIFDRLAPVDTLHAHAEARGVGTAALQSGAKTGSARQADLKTKAGIVPPMTNKPLPSGTVPGADKERGFLWESGRPPQPLPGTRDEARQIAALYNSLPLLGEDATEGAVRKRTAQASIIHLATHGVLRRDVPTASGVLLTAPLRDPAPSDDDGALQTWELFGLKLTAELVVLSACETGEGTNRPAEGLIGLTRALQYPGCRSIIASQWSVSDTSTAELMVALHQNLRQSLNKDVALQQAMKAVAGDAENRTAHPYYWAAFVLTGDPDNLNLGETKSARTATR